MSAASLNGFGSGKRKILAMLALLAVLAGAWPPEGRAQETRAQYEGIRDPLVGEFQAVVTAWAAADPTLGPLAAWYVVSTEVARIEAMNVYGALELEVDSALAKAISVHYVLNFRRGLETTINSGRLLIAKLEADLKWYDDKFPGFAAGTVNKANRKEVAYFANYQAIKRALESYEYEVKNAKGDAEKKVLKDAKKTLEEKFASYQKVLRTTSFSATRASFALTDMKRGVPAIIKSVNELNEVLIGLQQMAETLAKDGPHTQLLLTISNQSPNLMYFVQVLTPGDDFKTYTVRRDTLYPIPVYPNVLNPKTGDPLPKDELAKYQDVQPYGPRGPTEVRLPIRLREKVVIRAIGMGPQRDRIRFFKMPGGKTVRLEDSSLERGYYFLGYGAKTPNKTSATRLYSVAESFDWTLSNNWRGELNSGYVKLTSSGGKDQAGRSLRHAISLPLEPLKLTQDQLEWTIPASLDSVMQLNEREGLWAKVKGTTSYTHFNLTTGKSTKTENGEGQLKVYLELW